VFVNQLKIEREEKKELESSRNLDSLSSQLSTILGLDEMEANIYLNLLRVGPISASALAKEIDVERTKTYRTIEKLLNQNIVSTTFSKPKLCVATKPEEVLKMILQRKEDDLKLLKNTKGDVVKKINEIVPGEHRSNMPTFHIIQGKTNIYSNIGKLIESSNDNVYIVTTLKDISRMYHTSIPEKIKICEKKGGRVLLLTEINDEKLLPFVKRFGATEIRVGTVRSKGRMIVQKNNQMIMSDNTTKLNEELAIESDYAFSTNSIEMVNNIDTLCNFLWKNSKPLTFNIKKK
jgi:HTH-type transcriptional regulator, sugar sensing transcriptional regulator